MQLTFHRHFKKSFDKLPLSLQQKTEETLQLFSENPHHSRLKNHKLQGTLHEKRALWVTGDLRIIFEEFENYTLVLILDVGTHNQIY
jgi:addiction module RelE/StbE family toxin